MDRVSSNIIVNDFNKEKEKKMELQDRINGISDSYLKKLIRKREQYHFNKGFNEVNEPYIIMVSEVKYKCTEWWNSKTKNNNIYLESLQVGQDDWVQVEDLTELKVWEYNELVNELQEHYPDYPIEYLEGRFV